MSYPEDREYSYAQMAMRLTEYIKDHGSITLADARRITGGSKRRLRRLLRQMDGVLCVYMEGHRRVLLRDSEKPED